MHIRTFRAANLQAALEDIRLQMGPDASVLHTRQIREGLMGWLGRTSVEVTAGLRSADESTDSSTDAQVTSSGRHPDDTRMTLSSDSLAQDSSVSSVRLDSQGRTLAIDHYQANRNINPLLEAIEHELLQADARPDAVERWLAATDSFASSLGQPLAVDGWHEQIQRTVGRELSLAGPIRIQPGERHTVALVGPTGVGKTTTIAKLAAGFRIEARRRVGLLTIDTFRIAAVQQLKAYAEIMDLPMQVVENPSQMRPAMEKLGDVDLVLIDTAGRSPKSDARIDQLVDFMGEARPDETHLVLSATSSPNTIESVVRGFAPVRPTAAILTKLDETSSTAAVLSAVTAPDHASAVPISYITTGQQVPDDIEVAAAELLVGRMLRTKISPAQLDAA